MNIFNTTHFQAGQATGAAAGLGDKLGNIQGLSNLDPETLKLLEAESIAQGVDFAQVLEASQNGHDPQAVLELLAKGQKNSLDNSVTATQLEGNQNITQSKESISTQSNSSFAMVNGEVVEDTHTESKLENKELLQLLKNGEKPATIKQVGQTKLEKISKLNQDAPVKDQMAAVTLKEGNVERPRVMSAAAMTLAHPQVKADKNIKQTTTNQVHNEKTNLLNLNDFMAQQSPTMKKTAAQQAYKPISESMFNKKVEQSLPGVVNAPSQEMKLQDIMFGNTDANSSEQFSSQSQFMNNSNTTVDTANNAGKVFDISSLTGNESSNEIISKIENYIIQTRNGNQAQLDVSFEHQELGTVDLQVRKTAGQHLDIMIASNKAEGLDFLNRNQGELLAKLSSSGIQVGEFKLESSSSNSNQNLNQDNSKQQFAGQEGRGQHNSQSGQRESDARRRSELWEQFTEKEVA